MSKQFANSILITGANRGLGLQFVKILANQVGTLFAGCRKPSQAQVTTIKLFFINNVLYRDSLLIVTAN